MAKNKYNWDKLKLEYFTSPIPEVKDFFESKYSTYTGHIKSKTTGWRGEKEKLIQDCVKGVHKDLEKRMIEVFTPSREELSQIYKMVFHIIKAKAINLSQKVSKDEKGNIIVSKDLRISEAKIIWEIVRTEMGLPIRYYKEAGKTQIYEEDNNIIFY